METKFEKLTQVIVGEIRNNILRTEVELEETMNNEKISVDMRIIRVKNLIRELVLLELELQKLASMIIKN